MLAISSCERTCLRVFMDRESLRVNVTADRDGKSLSPEGGEQKWQEIKAGSSDLMECVDILTVNHSEGIRK